MLERLSPAKGARKRAKRVGCGPGSGHGKTSTRGHKGSGARSGSESGPGFEGGQMPLYRRIPKRGFHHPGAVRFEIVNLNRLASFAAHETVTPEALKAKRIVSTGSAVKILGTGELTVPLVVKAHAFSARAKAVIEKAGGTIEVLK